MKFKKTFYVTTPIFYPDDIPHLGHAYTTIAADVLAKWNHLQGKDVFFLTGTDEHGKKLENAAKTAGKSPKEFIDSIVPKFKEAWQKLNIKYDRFIRTTDKDHEEVVKNILQKVYEKGDIYKGKYEGFYCTACEAYYTERDAPDKICPIHKKQLELLKEESYFFKLSKYKKFLLELYKENPDFISPEHRRQEIINRVKEDLQDLSISRTSFKWGIPLPFDEKHITFVWFDALLNYISGIGYLKNRKQFDKFWPANVHLIGKDILWFHVVIFPAILMSANIKLPEKIFAHGWWTVHSEKIGKSAGNAIKIDQLINYAGVDSARYFLLKETPFGEDGDFNEKSLVARHNNELADKLGNLVSRVSTLAEKYGLEKAEQAKELESKELTDKVTNHLDNFEFDKALNEIFAYIDKCNTYIQETSPWITKDKNVLYRLANAIKDATIILSPFIPETCDKIAKTFNFKIDLKELNKPLAIKPIKKSDILFKKIDVDVNNDNQNKMDNNLKYEKINKKGEAKQILDNKSNKIIKPYKQLDNKIEGIINMNQIKYDDFAKLDLRVATIKKVEDIEGADNIYKLEVEIGKEGKRTIVAGIKQHYKKEELKGKQVIVITNLEPRKMKGVESQGMLLAASNEDHSKIVLLSPEKKIDSGSKVQ